MEVCVSLFLVVHASDLMLWPFKLNFRTSTFHRDIWQKESKFEMHLDSNYKSKEFVKFFNLDFQWIFLIYHKSKKSWCKTLHFNKHFKFKQPQNNIFKHCTPRQAKTKFLLGRSFWELLPGQLPDWDWLRLA